MWEYKITNSELGYRISREDGDVARFYDVRGNWNENKSRARLFYSRDDAAGALVLIKMKGEKIEETSNIKETKSEKQSWSEF